MSTNLKIAKEPFFKAPRAVRDIWALNFSYCSSKGQKMIMSRIQVDYRGYGIKDWMKAIDHIQRMISYDNGHSWQEQGQEEESGPYETGKLQTARMYFLDPETEFIISIFTKSIFSKDADARLTKVYYEISRDAGDTWSTARQVIHPGKEYNAEHWMPGITTGQQEIADQYLCIKLEDGTIVCGFTFCDPRMFIKEVRFPMSVVFLRARWNNDRSDLVWDMGQVITAPENVAPEGVCEPDFVHLGGMRLFTTMRCNGNQKKGIYSSRQCALSEDGGKTWGKPWKLKYDDGTDVFAPASISAFERDPATDKVYWFANILDKPVYGQGPRYPLAIAELDTERLCLKKDSVAIIQDLPVGVDDIQYSNFGHYVDRKTGEFVLTPAEMIPYSCNYETDDYYCFRVKILSG